MFFTFFPTIAINSTWHFPSIKNERPLETHEVSLFGRRCINASEKVVQGTNTCSKQLYLSCACSLPPTLMLRWASRLPEDQSTMLPILRSTTTSMRHSRAWYDCSCAWKKSDIFGIGYVWRQTTGSSCGYIQSRSTCTSQVWRKCASWRSMTYYAYT